MLRSLVFYSAALLIGACTGDSNSGDAGTAGTAAGTAEGGLPTAGPGGTGAEEASGTGGETQGDGTATGGSGSGGNPMEKPEFMDEGDCEYTVVHEQSGPLFTVSDTQSVMDVPVLGMDEGFFCMKVEFDIQTADNLNELVARDEGCPELLALASFYGSNTDGEFLATSFFRYMDPGEDDACVRGADRLDVGNYLNYWPGTEGPWPPGQMWHVELEAKPWVTRVRLFQGGAQVGGDADISLWPASTDDGRNPVVRLGQNRVTAGRFFPWYGASYSNLVVSADVAAAPGG